MRWCREIVELTIPSPGQRFRFSGFLWLPMRIGSEVRWLERAEWIAEWRAFKGGPGFVPVKWADPIPYTITEAGKAMLRGAQQEEG